MKFGFVDFRQFCRFYSVSQILFNFVDYILSKHPEFCPEILDKFGWLYGEENWCFGAILGKNLTVSGLNMTSNAFYHLNKVLNIHFIDPL